jgi:hypothetical protein
VDRGDQAEADARRGADQPLPLVLLPLALLPLVLLPLSPWESSP